MKEARHKSAYDRNQISGYLWEGRGLIGKWSEAIFLVTEMSVLIDKDVHYRSTCLVIIYMNIYDLCFSLYANYILNFLTWVYLFWVIIKFFTNLFLPIYMQKSKKENFWDRRWFNTVLQTWCALNKNVLTTNSHARVVHCKSLFIRCLLSAQQYV